MTLKTRCIHSLIRFQKDQDHQATVFLAAILARFTLRGERNSYPIILLHWLSSVSKERVNNNSCCVVAASVSSALHLKLSQLPQIRGIFILQENLRKYIQQKTQIQIWPFVMSRLENVLRLECNGQDERHKGQRWPQKTACPVQSLTVVADSRFL